MSAVLRQIQQGEQIKEGSSLESPFLSKIDTLIQKIKYQSGIYLNDKPPASIAGITQVLDEIKTLLTPLSKGVIESLLFDMQSRDSLIWSKFKWQHIKWDDISYHESNNPENDNMVGISVKQLIHMAESEKDQQARLRKLVLKLVQIYGFDIKLLSSRLL